MAWMPGHQRPMKSGTARRSVSPSVRLGFESLEPRVLLATAEFMVHLYRDDQGSPGARITDDTVEVGESFFVEITAREFHPYFSGLAGVALDIAWDPKTFREIDANFDPSDPNSNLITPDFPLYRHGWLDNDAGTIDDLAGIASKLFGVGRAIGDFQPERFSLLHFQAIQPAELSPFTMEQGRSRIVTVPVSSLGPSQLRFEPQTITVKPRATAPAAVDKTVAPNKEAAAALPQSVEPNTPPLDISAAHPVLAPPLPAFSDLAAGLPSPSELACHPEPQATLDADAGSPSGLASSLADADGEAPMADVDPATSSVDDADVAADAAATPLPPIDALPSLASEFNVDHVRPPAPTAATGNTTPAAGPLFGLALAYAPVLPTTLASGVLDPGELERIAFPSMDVDRDFRPMPWLLAAPTSATPAAQRDRLCGMESTFAERYAANLDELLGSDDFDLSTL